MPQNAAIDVAIGLILMYLVLSLLCTVVNEFIATKLNLRSATLKDALQKLIDDPTLLKNFYAHGLIASNGHAAATGSQTTLQAVASGSGLAAASAVGAAKTVMTKLNIIAPTPKPTPATPAPVKEEHPSYLAGGTVALALMGSLLKRQHPPLSGTPAPTAAFAAVKTVIDGLTVAPNLTDALQACLLQANGDIDKLRQGIATWFDDSMDRLSGAYKRKMKWIAMLIGLLIAIAFNADSFKVATTLWNDADRRASTVAIATQIAQKPLPTPAQSADRKKVDEEISGAEMTLRSLPIGWNCPAAGGSVDYWACAKQGASELTLVKILGWLLTAAALSLGAPFWFDLLNQFINLRGAGQKPAREDKKTT